MIINLNQKVKSKFLFLLVFSTASGGRGRKRLVRNGCISPQILQQGQINQLNKASLRPIVLTRSVLGNSVSSNIMSPISVDDIFAEDRGCGRVKGKWLHIHHHMELMLELFTMITATPTQTTQKLGSLDSTTV